MWEFKQIKDLYLKNAASQFVYRIYTRGAKCDPTPIERTRKSLLKI